MRFTDWLKHEHKGAGQITEWNVEKFRGEKSRKFRYVLSDYLFDLVEDDVADADDKTTQILKAIFTESITPEGLKTDGTTPEIIANSINMKEKPLGIGLEYLKMILNWWATLDPAIT